MFKATELPASDCDLLFNPKHKKGSILGYSNMAVSVVRRPYYTILCECGFMKMVPSVYTLLINTVYLSLNTQVAEGTLFRKHTVAG